MGRRRPAEVSGGTRSAFPREKLSTSPLCGAVPTALSMSTLPSRSGQSPTLASLCQLRPPPRRLPPEKAAATTDRATGLPTPSHQTPRSRRRPIGAAAGARRSPSRDCDRAGQLRRVGRVRWAFVPRIPACVTSQLNWVLLLRLRDVMPFIMTLNNTVTSYSFSPFSFLLKACSAESQWRKKTPKLVLDHHEREKGLRV